MTPDDHVGPLDDDLSPKDSSVAPLGGSLVSEALFDEPLVGVDWPAFDNFRDEWPDPIGTLDPMNFWQSLAHLRATTF